RLISTASRVWARMFHRMSVEHDVVVAGGGPAGIATAGGVVRRMPGVRVLVIDRARFPRPKPCGGGLTRHAEEAMRALGLELTVAHEAAPRARVKCGAEEREIFLGRAVRVVRREEFDASLVAQARTLGIEVREGLALDDYKTDRSGVTLSLGDG